jgi:glycosyltransferase involved in cell wall biosynthesis
MGVPSIISLKDKVDDVVQDGVNGIIIPEKSPQALARAILNLAEDHEMRTRLGRNAQSHFTKLNNPQRSAKQVLDIYKRLLGVS